MKNAYPYIDPSDSELVQQWLKGEESAFNSLYERYARWLQQVAARKTRCREMAREMVQEVFMELHLHRHSVVPGSCLRGYLFTILSNKLANHYRRLQVEQKYMEHSRFGNGATEYSASEILENRELKKKIDLAIHGLSRRCKTVFLLSRTTHLSNREIAARLNISVNTVEQHIRKARNVLRKSLARHK